MNVRPTSRIRECGAILELTIADSRRMVKAVQVQLALNGDERSKKQCVTVRVQIQAIEEIGVTIWVDADACPVVIRQILFRAAQRTSTQVTLVANQYLKTPASQYVRAVQVEQGFDVADDEIVRRCQAGDLVVTSDIPLADAVITKGCLALSPRGELFTVETIKSRLAVRDLMDTLRSSGVQTGGPSALSASDRQAFANALDRWLAQQR